MKLKLSNPFMGLFIRYGGMLYQVTAVCNTDDEANRLMAEDSSQSVITTDETGLIYLAKNDPEACQ